MSSFLLALKTILPLFLIILLGFSLIRMKAVTDLWVEVLNKYALWIGFPALIFTALVKLDFSLSENSTLLIANSIYLTGSMLLAFPIAAIFKTSVKTKQTLILVLAFGNITYLGIPVLVNVLGEKALGTGVILSSVYLFWMFSLALILVEVSGEGKVHPGRVMFKLFTNPLLMAVLLGTLASILKIYPGSSMMKSLELIAQSVTAVVLLSLGIFMGSRELGALREWAPIAGLSIVIMVILPGILFFSLKCTTLKGIPFQCSVLEAAMPLGLTPYALTEQYNLNPKLASRLVVLSTFLSMFILPFWIAITA